MNSEIAYKYFGKIPQYNPNKFDIINGYDAQISYQYDGGVDAADINLDHPNIIIIGDSDRNNMGPDPQLIELFNEYNHINIDDVENPDNEILQTCPSYTDENIDHITAEDHVIAEDHITDGKIKVTTNNDNIDNNSLSIIQFFKDNTMKDLTDNTTEELIDNTMKDLADNTTVLTDNTTEDLTDNTTEDLTDNTTVLTDNTDQSSINSESDMNIYKFLF